MCLPLLLLLHAAPLQPTTEAFRYPPGPLAGNGAAADGWAGPWEGDGTVSAGSLAKLTGGAAFRKLAAPVEAGTVWLGVTVRRTGTATEGTFAGVSLFDGDTEHLFVGQRYEQAAWGLDRSGHDGGNGPDIKDAAVRLVVRLDFAGDKLDARLWVDPKAEPKDTPAAELLGQPGFRFDRVRLATGNADAPTLEVRGLAIGAKYADVAGK